MVRTCNSLTQGQHRYVLAGNGSYLYCGGTYKSGLNMVSKTGIHHYRFLCMSWVLCTVVLRSERLIKNATVDLWLPHMGPKTIINSRAL